MPRCFGMLVVEAMIRGIGDDGDLSPFEPLGISLELPPDIEETVDAAAVEREAACGKQLSGMGETPPS